jgi:hypothetical protein
MKATPNNAQSSKRPTQNWQNTEGGYFDKIWQFFKRKLAESPKPLSPDQLLQDHSRIVQTGQRIRATVLGIDDAGKMVNFNPIVRLNLRLDDAQHSEIAPETIVSLLHLPRVQEQITIAYLPEMPHLVAII